MVKMKASSHCHLNELMEEHVEWQKFLEVLESVLEFDFWIIAQVLCCDFWYRR